MTKKIPQVKRKLGRPQLGVTRRSVSITDEDHAYLKSFAFGKFSTGLRRALEELRALKRP